ncbi:MAG: hypothetical protein HFH35_12930 [Eubacterium sp.]|nr:hypothetical protein [Eubacterium sp.]
MKPRNFEYCPLSIILSNKFHIQLSTENEEIQEYKDKIKFLYEIGYLGIFVNRNYKSKYQMVTQPGFALRESERRIQIKMKTDCFGSLD